MAARELQVMDYTVEGVTRVIKAFGDFPRARDLKLAVEGPVGVPAHRLLLLLQRHGGRLLLDDAALPALDLGTAPEIGIYRRQPDDQALQLTVHSPWEYPVRCTLRADARIRQLKGLVARRVCIAQWKQVLTVFGTATANDDDFLGAYAVARHTDVFLSSTFYSTNILPLMITVSVLDGTTGRSGSVGVELRDTVEVLLAKLETAGMLEVNEPARIFLGNEQLQPGHNFENFDTQNTLLLVKGNR